MNKKPYCPQSGCGRPNGAAPPCPVTCKSCNYGHRQDKPYELTNFDKYCPLCNHCLSCGRIIKKVYNVQQVAADTLRTA